MNSNPKPDQPRTRRRFTVPFSEGVRKHSVATFLAVLVVVFVTMPFVQAMPDGRYVEILLVTALLIFAILAVGGRRTSLLAAILLGAPVFVTRWNYHFQQQDRSFSIYIACFLLFLGYIVFHFLRFIIRSPRVTSEVLCAGVATYLLLAMLWAAAYALVSRLAPGSFTGLPAGQPLLGFDALYFSGITLTTVGYGDITPVSPPARMLAMMEAFTGSMYMAVLVARLVSLYSAPGPVAESEKPRAKD
jgi:hypothetical protein